MSAWNANGTAAPDDGSVFDGEATVVGPEDARVSAPAPAMSFGCVAVSLVPV